MMVLEPHAGEIMRAFQRFANFFQLELRSYEKTGSSMNDTINEIAISLIVQMA
jgi:hypothetical protein